MYVVCVRVFVLVCVRSRAFVCFVLFLFVFGCVCRCFGFRSAPLWSGMCSQGFVEKKNDNYLCSVCGLGLAVGCQTIGLMGVRWD